MAIRRPPSKAIHSDAEREARTAAFINGGLQIAEPEPAPVPKAEPVQYLKPKDVLLTIPGDMHKRLAEALEARRVRIPRHTWLLEAIVDKLDREEGK